MGHIIYDCASKLFKSDNETNTPVIIKIAATANDNSILIYSNQFNKYL